MQIASKRLLAALLVSTVLAVPGGAMAASLPTVAMEKPVTNMPLLPAPGQGGGESEGLVAPKLTRDEAIAVALRYFTIPAELGEPNVGIQQSREGATWTLEWSSPSKQAERTRIAVGVDAVTGTIANYSAYTSGQEAALQLTLTRAEARAMAEEWFAKLVPAEHRSSLRYLESPLQASYWGGTSYQFNWVRDVKGYPLTGNGVNITVDARTGALTQYGLTWQQGVDLALPETSLTAAEAEAAYRRQIPLVLQYQRFQKRGTDEGEWRLVYRPLIESFPRMNQEGALVDGEGKVLDLSRFGHTRLVPASEKPYQKPAQPLTQEDALSIARGLTGRTETPSHSSYSEYGEETKRKAWDFNWTAEGGEGQPRSEQRVRIDAETGIVTETSHWTETKPFDKDEVVPVSLEQAQEKAVAFIRTYRPDLAGSVQLMANRPDRYGPENPDYRPTEYYIGFQQLKNGVPIAGRELQVSISARTGEIRYFYSGWWDENAKEEFPAAQPLFSAEQALDIFFKYQGIEQAWVTFWSREKNQQTRPTLLWQPSSKLSIQSIDAMTGAPMDWDGRNLIEAMRFPTDIKGHYAEREIELLWVRGVFDLQDGKFNPDMVISADELSRWIVLARGMRPYMAYDFAMAAPAGGRAMMQASESKNSAYFGAAFQSGIILPEDLAGISDLNGPVSRELFSLWAARAMGYSRLVKMAARIEMGFTDRGEVGAKYQNAVAILGGLGIMQGDGDGTFGPQRWLTRAQAAKILFAVSSN